MQHNKPDYTPDISIHLLSLCFEAGAGTKRWAELLARVVVSCLNHMINMAAYSMDVFTTQCRCLVYASCLPSSCVYSAGRESSNLARNFGCT